MTSTQKKTPHIWIALAWTLVLIPLGWGVYQSLVKSLPLFQTPARAAASHSDNQ